MARIAVCFTASLLFATANLFRLNSMRQNLVDYSLYTVQVITSQSMKRKTESFAVNIVANVTIIIVYFNVVILF